MGNKKIPHLDEETLFDLGKAEKIQQSQIFNLEEESLQIREALDDLDSKQLKSYTLGKGLIAELEGLLCELENVNIPDTAVLAIEEAFAEYEQKQSDGKKITSYDIKKTREVITNNNWNDYFKNLSEYANSFGVDDAEDPFLTMLSENEYKELAESIDGVFAKKTNIRNKVDLKFLSIAVALEVAKGLLYPIIAQEVGYGQQFNPNDRVAHNDKSIEEAHKKANNEFRDRNIKKKGAGKWIEFLYQTVPYDITAGTGVMENVNLHGGAHRLYTLGHDPILGWIFGTANILTDVITIAPGAISLSSGDARKVSELLKVASMESYRIVRKPKMMVTSERVSLLQLFKESYDVVNEHPMNLPAAIFTEGQHLKSDLNTKMGLPVPVVEMFSPEFASKLYTNNYDALCFARDMKIISKSATISILIDTIIGLIHGLYYDPQKDGSRDLYEVRTRKILLIANTIGTSSNLIFSYFSGNIKALDIGGLLVTLSHLFSDTRFLLNIKKEFVENKLYEKIDSEIKELDKIEEELLIYANKHKAIYD